MIYGSVCSGIEAATQAWHPLGWRPAFFSEVERFPCEVLAHHYGSNMPGEPITANGVPNLGDMTKFEGWPDYAIRLLVGGTPCQDYSLAGKRLGMAGGRGQLSLTFIEILGRYLPAWFVWENVPGVLSSNDGRDFARFLGDLSGQKIGVPKDGWKNSGIVSGIADAYGLAWRVFDAQFMRTCRFPAAVPQRRRRVFVVGYLGNWRPAAAVLLDRDSLRGDSPPRRRTGQGFVADVASSLGASSRGVRTAGETRGQDPIVAQPVAHALDASYGRLQGASGQDANHGHSYLVAQPAPNPLTARMHKGVNMTADEGQPMVAHALRGEGFDASEDGTGRGTPIVPVAFSSKDYGNDAMLDVSLTVRAGRHDGSHANAGIPPAVAIQERATAENPASGPDGAGVSADGSAYTLEARGTPQAVADLVKWEVRRLMPVECERLQGFPDDFTRIPYRGRPADKCPDGPRYKSHGNSMSVNVMHYIGERIQLVDDLIEGKAE